MLCSPHSSQSVRTNCLQPLAKFKEKKQTEEMVVWWRKSQKGQRRSLVIIHHVTPFSLYSHPAPNHFLHLPFPPPSFPTLNVPRNTPSPKHLPNCGLGQKSPPKVASYLGLSLSYELAARLRTLPTPMSQIGLHKILVCTRSER